MCRVADKLYVDLQKSDEAVTENVTKAQGLSDITRDVFS